MKSIEVGVWRMEMSFAVSSNVAASICSSPFSSSSSSSSYLPGRFLHTDHKPFSVILPPHRLSPSVVVFARRKNQKAAVTSASPQRRNKKGFGVDDRKEGDEDLDEDPFETLFNLLEEDLKNDKSAINDEEINEEEFDALASELAEVLGDDGDMGLFGSALETDEGDAHDNGDDNVDDEDVEDDDSEEEERPVKLKNWQLRRLAYALKSGRRKTSIKNLAAELCLDRAYVLELLRDPPPNLLMLSATLPDEPPSVAVAAENRSSEPVAEETTAEKDANVKETSDVMETEKDANVEEPVHVMQQRWSSLKRLKKVHIETLERVYRRSKRPTNSMVSSIVQVTNLPRKRIVKWFEDKRTEDGIPENRKPYQRLV